MSLNDKQYDGLVKQACISLREGSAIFTHEWIQEYAPKADAHNLEAVANEIAECVERFNGWEELV